ncbi:MAG: hypothetical protein IPL84_04250 [Chitinophagaceae bacterium]|nr:hypothetical protein [Chitinophagaceae bacterium]
MKLFFSILCCLSCGIVFAQEKEKTNTTGQLLVGADVKWYPAGWILGPSVAYLVSPKQVVSVGIGINLANRKDFSGLNDDEKGTGFGGHVGYRFLFNPTKSSFFLGARVDLWGLQMDWKDKVGTPQASNGTTRITVFQPTAEIGYWLKLKDNKWNLLFSGGGGAEINVKTSGKEVGQGGIWLLGVSAFYAL